MSSKSSARSGGRRVSLQRRDLDILESLVVLRAETLSELHRQHFGGLSRKRAVNRLAQLARAGYLHGANVYLHGEHEATRVYTLGPKARPALEQRSLSSEHFRYRRWNPTLRDASIPHQIVVNRLGRLLDLSLVPEHLLPVVDKNGARNRPDAVVEGIDRDGRPMLLGIEVDLGHYSRERILAKQQAWAKLPDHGQLLFVVPDSARAERVRRWLRHSSGSVVLTREQFVRDVDSARGPEGEGLYRGLDLWENGAAWEREHERQREQERRWAEEDQRREAVEAARIERERIEAQQAAAAREAAAARPIGRRRRRV